VVVTLSFYIETMVSDELADDFEQLVDLIASTEDIKSVLGGLTGFAADMMSKTTKTPIECAVTLRMRKRTATIGGSSDRAVVLDRIEQALGDGPCVDALDNGVPVLLGDVQSDPRWPEYRGALAAADVGSALGVPMILEEDSGAVLDFFAPEPGLFTEEAISGAVQFAEMASKPLRLAIKIASSNQRSHDLKAAMENRTVIDLACGMIMAQNRCSQDEAYDFLRRASNERNQKLYELAQSIVERLGGPQKATTHFE
jgi:hypothetical protein